MLRVIVNVDRIAAEDKVLSGRELQVAIGYLRGHTCKEIADKLNLSMKTISCYKSRILEGWDVKNSSEIFAYGVLRGYIEILDAVDSHEKIMANKFKQEKERGFWRKGKKLSLEVF
jgi:DNA-binding CsgD family transcriptional regulator